MPHFEHIELTEAKLDELSLWLNAQNNLFDLPGSLVSKSIRAIWLIDLTPKTRPRK